MKPTKTAAECRLKADHVEGLAANATTAEDAAAYRQIVESWLILALTLEDSDRRKL